MFFQDKNIFIVENNDICQRLYQELFTMVPCEMRLFESAEGVLDAAKQKLPDIIIMDIGLPKVSGLELTKLLRTCSQSF